MLSRRKDFHGGRDYASDASPGGKRFGSSAGLAIGWIKLQLGRWAAAVSPSAPQGPPRRSEGYSLLGSDGRHAFARDVDTRAFPIADRRRSTAGASEVV